MRVRNSWLLGGAVLLGWVIPWHAGANDSSVGETVATAERARSVSRAKMSEGAEPRAHEQATTKSVESATDKSTDKSTDKPTDKSTDKPAENYIDKMFDGGPGNDRLTKMHAAHDDLMATLRTDGHFSQFLKIVEASGFDKTLHGRGPFTVFVPTDEAFAKLPSELRESMQKDPSRLRGLLAYHVIRGLVSKDVLNHLRNIKTMSGAVVNVDYTSGIRINHAHLTSGDHYGSNGMFHAVDELLSLPERPAANKAEPSSARKKGPRKASPTS